jgi:NADPH:quinone reductase-like Zn-dependent oxidoreductase
MDTSFMQAAVFRKYGAPEVVKIEMRPKPVPGNHQVLIRNYASAVNSGDWKLRQADPAAARLFIGLFRPRKSKQILGAAFAGVVESVGRLVTEFKPGDHVFGATGFALGTHATYVCVHQDSPIAGIGRDICFTDAAAIPFGATTALHFLRKANLKAGQEIMIYGASGAVGIAAIQLAKYFGATVTAVCSTANKALVIDSGADHHVDYNHPDFENHTHQYDVVFETVGKLPLQKAIALTRENGTVILGSGGFYNMLFARGKAKRKNRKLVTGLALEKKEEMIFLSTLLKAGVIRPVIDTIFPLNKIVDAHRLAQSGRKKGNAVVKL